MVLLFNFDCFNLKKREVNMQKFKKALLFILGFLFIPTFLGHISASILGNGYFKSFSGYFVVVYLLIYFLFPFIYQKNTLKIFHNKYIFYITLYFIFWILGVFLFIEYQT